MTGGCGVGDGGWNGKVQVVESCFVELRVVRCKAKSYEV